MTPRYLLERDGAAAPVELVDLVAEVVAADLGAEDLLRVQRLAPGEVWTSAGGHLRVRRLP